MPLTKVRSGGVESVATSLLTGTTLFGMNIIENFMTMVNGIGEAGFVGLLALLLVMYFFLCDKCVK